MTDQAIEAGKSLIYDLPIFSYLSKTQKDTICHSMILLKYESGQIIYKKGRPASTIYIVASGEV